jgi:hypothetical protein
MAQIAIAIVAFGAVYLMSNEKEGFEGDPSKPENQFHDLAEEKAKDFRNSYDKSKHTMNNEGTYSQYQDKYFSKTATQNDPLFNNVKDAKFVSLNGETVPHTSISHNNMNVFYGSKSYGALPNDDYEHSTLDHYSGAGSFSIEKKEISPMFKPETSMQNVYGNQNQSDFFQSRVNESMRHANSLPWEQVRDNKGEAGFNWSMADRDKSMPKSVDELRVANKTKTNFSLDYKAPAYDPKVNTPMVEHLGKFVKKGPETYHVNGAMEMMGVASAAAGHAKPMAGSSQMLTMEQRDTTNVEYYGTRGGDDMGYTNKGDERFVHKQTLTPDTNLNFANSTFNPVNTQNYGKPGYKAYTNNRENDTDYFGAIQGAFISNVVTPLVKTLKHTKKKDSEAPLTNFKGTVKSMVFNPREHLQVTNREMNTEKIGLNHLSVERQNATGYQVANPYLHETQRPSTNMEIFGQANGVDKQRSYGAEYNQRNFQKPYENRTPNGNGREYHTDLNYKVVNKEQVHDYATIAVKPGVPHVQFMGEQTKNVCSYENINENYHNEDLLKAFKSNPYTQPLGSFA